MAKIFLTGSTSYLGSKFIQLYGDQCQIFGVARSDKKHPLDLNDSRTVENMYREFEPDVILHIAADLGRDTATADTILKRNPAVTELLVSLAQDRNTPFIFTSTEAVYGGKETTGEYVEDDPYQPRSLYGKSKAISEEIIIKSGLPHLIIRGHRFVGINKTYNKAKQFPDTLNALTAGQEIHLDSHKLFRPTFINNICDVFMHYIQNDATKQFIFNIGTDRSVTFFEFMRDVAITLGLNENLIKSDGEEAGWPQNSTLSIQKIKQAGYPVVAYEEILTTMKQDALCL